MRVHEQRQGRRTTSRRLGHLPDGEAARSLIASRATGVDDRQQVRPPALVPEQEADAAIPEQRRQVVPIRGRADEVLSGATSAAEHNRWCGGYPGLVRTLPPDLHRQPAAVDA